MKAQVVPRSNGTSSSMRGARRSLASSCCCKEHVRRKGSCRRVLALQPQPRGAGADRQLRLAVCLLKRHGKARHERLAAGNVRIERSA